MEFAFRINDGTPIRAIESIFDEYKEYSVSLIHESSIQEVDEIKQLINLADNFAFNIFIKEGTGTRYRNKFSDYRNVLLEDSFNKLERNSDYEGEEFFSDLVYSYEDEGYFGFGDYSIVGDHFTEGGGQARACAIHITYEEEQREEVWGHHFLSNPRNDVEDGATLASEAIEQLVLYVREYWEPESYTEAIKEFCSIYDSGKQTSLAYVKKLSMRHHLELIDSLLD
nr:sce7725 family protein [Grimontia hollisae]